MQSLKFTAIESDGQYNEYCQILEELVGKDASRATKDEIDLLTLLIDKWDEEHNTF